jgi:hypothetical protein
MMREMKKDLEYVFQKLKYVIVAWDSRGYGLLYVDALFAWIVYLFILASVCLFLSPLMQ